MQCDTVGMQAISKKIYVCVEGGFLHTKNKLSRSFDNRPNCVVDVFLFFFDREREK